MATALAITFLFSVLILAAVPSTVGFQDYVMYSDLAETLSPGQSLNYDMRPQRLPYGPHSLVLSNDCNLVLTAYGNQVWTTNITVKNGQNCYLSLLPDGEVKYRPIPRSNTQINNLNFKYLEYRAEYSIIYFEICFFK